jgi:flavin-binding protein dodecin
MKRIGGLGDKLTVHRSRALRALWVLAAAALLLAGCANAAADRQLTATPTAMAADTKPTAETALPTSSPTTWDQASNLATLRAEATVETCSAAEVVAYANEILPLASDHLRAARAARELQPWREGEPEFEQEYIEADARLKQLRQVLAPACADKIHLKFTNSFELLLSVWDHLGEGEFEVGQRQLASTFDEFSQAADLLSQLEAGFSQRN